MPEIELKIGQIWRDMDPRMNERFLRIIDIKPGNCYRGVLLQRCTEQGRDLSGQTRISTHRLNGYNYKLVKEAEPAA
jgi:hypothetical protein